MRIVAYDNPMREMAIGHNDTVIAYAIASKQKVIKVINVCAMTYDCVRIHNIVLANYGKEVCLLLL